MGVSDHYVVYVDALTRYSMRSNLPPNWTWRRVSSDTLVVAQGQGHCSMQSCLEAARVHMVDAGEASIRIDLEAKSIQAIPVVARA